LKRIRLNRFYSIQEYQRGARRSLKFTRRQIIDLHMSGMKVNAISKALCISHGCVSKIISRYDPVTFHKVEIVNRRILHTFLQTFEELFYQLVNYQSD
uniref:Paired domain-containing protein n=1 Tax=Haemonchus placei TaxID=6290 RepID=A0A0N4W5K9_HAEPC